MAPGAPSMTLILEREVKAIESEQSMLCHLKEKTSQRERQFVPEVKQIDTYTHLSFRLQLSVPSWMSRGEPPVGLC